MATATIRQAHNRHELIKLVKQKFDWDMIILSEKEEAYYGYLAVVNSTSLTEGISVDMGGGSTEVTYFKNRELVHSHSFPFGALTLKALYQDDLIEQENAQKVRQFVKDQFESLPWLKDRHIPLIGIGGSARNMAQIDQNEKSYPMAGLHQYQMNVYDINQILNYLISMPLSKREKVEGLSKDRADIIIPAIETFKVLYETVKADQFILSQKGLRDGINYSWLLANHDTAYFPNVLEESLNEIVMRYNQNMNQISHVHFLTRKIFNQLVAQQLKTLTQADWSYLSHAIYVFNLGQYIDSESSAQHTFYLLANQTIDGLLNHEKLIIALIASYKDSVHLINLLSLIKAGLQNMNVKSIDYLAHY